MSKISREVPKAVAAFGERQFRETGALAVEVLRIKEVVLRKHFRELKGVLYLVAVVSLDRVRVYFFNAAGVMVIGENLETSLYDEVRKSSKLLAKFEKPRQLTAEEIRIEATQDLRDALGKAIRRVSRLLSLKEPEFPDIFVTRMELDSECHNFGVHITDDNELLFEELVLTKPWIEGLLLRAAFLLNFDKSQWKSDMINCVGNSIAVTLLKGEPLNSWCTEWKRRTKATIWEPLVNHFLNHSSTYSPRGYQWLTSLLRELPAAVDHSAWMNCVRVIHDSLTVPLGTEEYHILNAFCGTLGNPNQLAKPRHLLESIHLLPRVLCDPSSLGVHLSIERCEKPAERSWVSISYIEGSAVKSLDVFENRDHVIDTIEYWLNLQDLVPLTGGPVSHGQSIVNRALGFIGKKGSIKGTFEATLELKESSDLEQKEKAVLERLSLGDTDILSNTLIGSPMIVRNLVQAGVVVFAPSFNHLGIQSDFLIHGPIDKIRGISHLVPEATLFHSEEFAYAVLSAPANWRNSLIESITGEDISLWPILSVKSSRQLIRYEDPFPLK